MYRSLVRTSTAVAAVGIAAVVLSACSGSQSPAPEATGPATLTIAWWGSDDRAAATQAAIDLFEEKYPEITVQANPLPFDGYFDLLSTQLAANDAPDVMQLTGDFVAEYGSRGALADLTEVDTTNLDAATTDAARLDDGLLGVPTGASVQAVVANKTLFDAAGVAMPDDKTWTWDDYVDIAAQISAASPDGVYGAGPFGLDGVSFGSYLTQYDGSNPYDEDGQITATPEAVESYFDLTKRLFDSGGSPGPEAASEQAALPLEQTGTATNTYAMGMWGAAQFGGLTAASGEDLELLRFPSKTGDLADNAMAVGTPQYWSGSARSQYPGQAQLLIDFLANDVDAGKLLGTTRGTPPNSEVRDALVPELADADAASTDFTAQIAEESDLVVPLPPPGYGIFQDTMRRYAAEFMFGRMSASDAATGYLDELKSATGSS